MGEPALQTAELHGACARFVWSDGFEAEFAAAWLLDNAAAARNAAGQHLTSAQFLREAGPPRHVSLRADTIHLEFARDSVQWSAAALRDRAKRRPALSNERILWPDGSDIAARPPISYSAYLTDYAVLETALSEFAKFGLVRFEGAGIQSGELERSVRRFGFIRETNYGRLFEVRVVGDPDNLANTSRALEPHTDNPYRDPVPTIQLLHCIRNVGSGGATFFIDGLALAEWLRASEPGAFAQLSRHAVPFAFRSAAGERYEACSPVIRLAEDGNPTGIRLNHRALGSVDLGTAPQTARWYEAYLTFALEAQAPARRLSLNMRPGDIAIFDNECVLHGRDAFPGSADRLLEGCYSDRDGLFATLARLRR